MGRQVSGRNYAQVVAKEPPQKSVLLVYPKEKDSGKTSKDLTETLRKTVNLKQTGIKVVRVSNIKNSGVAIEMKDQESAQKAKELFQKCAEVRAPKKRKPKVILFDVASEYEPEELTADLYDQNFKGKLSEEEFRSHFKPVFKTGPKDRPVTNWVCETNGQMFREITREGRLFLQWGSYKCREF